VYGFLVGTGVGVVVGLRVVVVTITGEGVVAVVRVVVVVVVGSQDSVKLYTGGMRVLARFPLTVVGT